ncbi:MAG: TrmH family RNA methyltransferase [Acidimicrobiales bacterium]
MTGSPRERYLTVFGRKPVLEALRDPRLAVAKVLVSERAGGASLDEVLGAARRSGTPVERVSEAKVAAVAGNARHHQGVVADVEAPRMSGIGAFLERRRGGRSFATTVLVLDHLHNPANVGLVIRSAAAAGLDGVVVPKAGCAELGPLVLKASAGVAFAAPIVRAATTVEALEALAEARFTIVGLSASAPETLFEAALPERAAYVLGNETDGVSADAAAFVERWLSIPVASPVESLNVACAATLVAYEAARRRARG